jgi:uncharacterized protein (DUF302 family)
MLCDKPFIAGEGSMRRTLWWLGVAAPIAVLSCSDTGDEIREAPPSATDSTAVASTSGTTAFGDDVGLRVLVSANSFDKTLGQAEAAVNDEGLAIIARVDHSAAARKAGLDLAPSTVLIFGRAEAGTPLIAAAPTAAIDLPAKLLVWQEPSDNAEGIVRVAFNEPAYLAWRHEIPADTEPLADIGAAVARIASQAIKPR